MKNKKKIFDATKWKKKESESRRTNPLSVSSFGL